MAKAKTDEPILQEALEKFEESHSSSDQNRREAHDDIVFSRLAKQWPDEIVKQRQAEGRPCLTINRLLPLIRQVVNDARQNTPSVQVSPVDSGADLLWVRPPSPTPAHEEETPGKGSSTFNIHNVLTGPVTEYP